MKQALISPEETVYKYDGTILGERVAEVADAAFPIAPPLFWVNCADDVVAGQFYYDPNTMTISQIPVKPPVEVSPVTPSIAPTVI
jgi:hypothetical protein